MTTRNISHVEILNQLTRLGDRTTHSSLTSCMTYVIAKGTTYDLSEILIKGTTHLPIWEPNAVHPGTLFDLKGPNGEMVYWFLEEDKKAYVIRNLLSHLFFNAKKKEKIFSIYETSLKTSELIQDRLPDSLRIHEFFFSGSGGLEIESSSETAPDVFMSTVSEKVDAAVNELISILTGLKKDNIAELTIVKDRLKNEISNNSDSDIELNKYERKPIGVYDLVLYIDALNNTLTFIPSKESGREPLQFRLAGLATHNFFYHSLVLSG